MSEGISSAENNVTSVMISSETMTAGVFLKEARESAGLQIDNLALLLKVPVSKIHALESDRYDLLLDMVFVRALAASICRTLKIDPSAVLEKLPNTEAPQLKADKLGINSPFRTSNEAAGLFPSGLLSKPIVLAVIALLIGIVLIVMYPFIQSISLSGLQKSDTSAIIVPAETVVPVNNLLIAAPAQAVNSVLLNQTAPLVSTASSLPAAMTTPNETNVPVLVAGTGATTGMVVIKAHASTWIEVIDAAGVVLVRKTLADGEVVGSSGQPPLSVVVGRADTAEVRVHGKPFDLSLMAKDNVARFEVK